VASASGSLVHRQYVDLACLVHASDPCWLQPTSLARGLAADLEVLPVAPKPLMGAWRLNLLSVLDKQATTWCLIMLTT
jgi:hypothetical protein